MRYLPSLFLILLLLSLLLQSCKSNGAKQVAEDRIRITGTVEEPVDRIVTFHKFRYYIPVEKYEVEKVTLDDENSFSIEINWPHQGVLYLVHGEEELPFFLKPGQEIHIHTSGKDPSGNLTVTGDDARTNEFLNNQMHKFNEAIPFIQQTGLGKSSEIFLKIVDTTLGESRVLLNTEFNTPEYEEFYNFFDRSLHYNTGSLMLLYGTFQEQQQLHPLPDDYFSFLDTMEVNHPDAIYLSAYSGFLQAFLNYQFTSRGLAENLTSQEDYYMLRLNLSDELFEGKNRDLATAIDINNMFRAGLIDKADSLMQELEKTATDPVFAKVLKPAYDQALKLTPGNPAPDFTYPDRDGNEVSLSDYRGNVVYLDVWASWCGPCLREFPHTAGLYETFSGEDVVFMYVSIDRERDEWIDGLETHELKGVNLYAGNHFDAEIINDYNIRGIPRYIIIDREGNLYDNNAPRPSGNADQAIREALDKTL